MEPGPRTTNSPTELCLCRCCSVGNYFTAMQPLRQTRAKGGNQGPFCLLLWPLQAVTVESDPSVLVLLVAWLTESTGCITHGNSRVWTIFMLVSNRVKLYLQRLFKKPEFLMFLIKLKKFFDMFLFKFS